MIINIEVKRQPEATKTMIRRIYLLLSERILVSLRIPCVDYDTETKILFIAFFKVNQTDRLSCVNKEISRFFNL